MVENPLEQLYRVAGGQMEPPRRAGALTGPLLSMLAADPAQRPTMERVRDQLASLAAGDGRTITAVLTARTPLRPVPVRTLREVPAASEPPSSPPPPPAGPRSAAAAAAAPPAAPPA